MPNKEKIKKSVKSKKSNKKKNIKENIETDFKNNESDDENIENLTIKSKIIKKTKNSANKFKSEFRKHIVIGITSALGFLIALTWREPLSEFVSLLIEDLGLKQQLLYKFISAVLFTFIAVIILVFISKWNVEKK